MPIIPVDRAKQVEFFSSHAPVWAAAQAQIGITDGQAGQVAALAAAAREAQLAARRARAAAAAATQEYYNACAALRGYGGGVVQTIKSFARLSGDPGVLAAAQLPAPAAPSPAPRPAAPTDLRAAISPTGEVALRWRARHAGVSTGIVFTVQRRTGAGPWALAAATSGKSFADGAAAAALARGEAVLYRVRAQRGGRASAWCGPMVVDLGGAAAAGAGGERSSAAAA